MASNAKNVVEINGRLYDSKTGLPANSPIIKNPNSTGVIDGFVTNKPKAPSKSAAKKRKPASKASTVHKKTKKASTLSRDHLEKPKLKKSVSRRAKPKAKVESNHEVPAERIQRAHAHKKSNKISRFGRFKPSQEVEASTQAPTMAPPTAKKAPKLNSKQSMIKGHVESAKPITEETQKTTTRQKIAKAAKKRPKAISVSAGVITAALVLGYVVYLNIPNLSLRVAAREAGFEANMPGYQPSGFKFGGPISYEQGRITVRFNSKTDERQFSITQRETNWDSQSLLNNFVASNSSLYQTYQERGLTIYVYNGSEASWVNGGIWYTVEGDSSLNAEQLIKIAASL